MQRGPDLVISHPHGLAFFPAAGLSDGLAITHAESLRWDMPEPEA